MEIRRDGQGRNVTHFFEAPDEPRRWRVNPDWTYCEYIRGAHPSYNNNKEGVTMIPVKLGLWIRQRINFCLGLILHFLREIQLANHSWPWRNTGLGNKSPFKEHSLDSQIYICKPF